MASWSLVALALYALTGLSFGLHFVVRRVQVLDPAARGAGWGFRLLILPGVVALWPVLIARGRAGRGGPVP